MTEWREYPYNKEYLVSSDGELLGWWKGHKTRRKLKSYVSPCGYAMHKVMIDGNWVSKGVHRIMAETFIPNPLGLSDVDHINGDKLDNRLENLRWLTHKDNCQNRDMSNVIANCGKTRRGIISFDDAGNEVKKYSSVTEAAMDILICKKSKSNSRQSVVANLVSGIKKGLIRYGFYWKYA
jgi:hypothetical protein